MTDDFHRLAKGLRAVEIDFDYYRTRKLLDPNWDGYDIPPGHDIINDNLLSVTDANIVTSQHRDNPDIHSVVLDLDYGLIRQPPFNGGGERITLTRNRDTNKMFSPKYLMAALPPSAVRTFPGKDVLHLDPICDYALMPSTTDGHFHLMLDLYMSWSKYQRLLKLFVDCGIVEPGYVKASIARGFTAIRPPWIKKPKTVERQQQWKPTKHSPNTSPASSKSEIVVSTGPGGNPKLSAPI
jgi:hypothetical protein